MCKTAHETHTQCLTYLSPNASLHIATDSLAAVRSPEQRVSLQPFPPAEGERCGHTGRAAWHVPRLLPNAAWSDTSHLIVYSQQKDRTQTFVLYHGNDDDDGNNNSDSDNNNNNNTTKMKHLYRQTADATTRTPHTQTKRTPKTKEQQHVVRSSSIRVNRNKSSNILGPPPPPLPLLRGYGAVNITVVHNGP